MDDEEEWSAFMWACYDLAIEFLDRKKDCTQSTVYLRQEDLAKQGSLKLPEGEALAVTIGYVPLAEIEMKPE